MVKLSAGKSSRLLSGETMVDRIGALGLRT
jgi:hypothetical protein